jgi:hypothetical protein
MTVGVYIKQLSDGSPGGTTLGQSATDLISFHGATAVAQAAVSASVSTTAPVSGAFGFSTSAQAIAVLTALNDILTCLKNKGLMASS